MQSGGRTRRVPSQPPRRPEVLAPAGDRDAMRAAVRAGADAVYFGLQGFNARARATNFDESQLAETMRFLHAHGVKGYVTLNTLVFDAELPVVEAAVRACAASGVDAVIVQDLGVARLTRAIAPELPIHASTQMTCTDAESVELARELGAARVILARELSVDDIAAIRDKTSVELEVFVHGALCVSYSGQCLTSEAFGGRSANRGACAQACRLPYELHVDGIKRDLGDRAFLLSPEDLEATALVPRLIELGIASLKIEGRLKGPEYVAATTELYRRAIDGAIDERQKRAALQMYSRGSGPGFLAGVDHQRLVEGRSCDHRGTQVGTSSGARDWRGRRCVALTLTDDLARGDGILVEGGIAGEGEIGGRVWTIVQGGADVESARAGGEVLAWLGPDKPIGDVPTARRVFKTSDPAREKEVLAKIERDPIKLRVDMTLSGRIGEPFTLSGVTAKGAHAEVTGDANVELARSAPLDEAALREKLAKLGDTPLVLGELTVSLPPRSIVPISSINRARRALVLALDEAAHCPHPTTEASVASVLSNLALEDHVHPPPAGLFVLCRTLEQAEAAVDAGADGVYLDFLELTGTGAAVRALRSGGRRVHITLAPPRIRKPGEEKIDKYLADLTPDALLVRGLGALREGGPFGIPRIGDFSLNVTNSITAHEVLARGLVAFTPSFDLDAAQLTTLLSSPLGEFAEVVVHHPMPLFHMEHCVFAALMSDGKDFRTCGRPCEKHAITLRDRQGMDHPVEADVGCRNTVFHAAPQSAAHLVSSLKKSGTRRFRIELVREQAADVKRVVAAYRSLLDDAVAAEDVWRALKTEGGYGVVKGSLRVIPN